MSSQMSFPDPPTTRHTDPTTSHAAARDTQPNAGTNRWLALATLIRHPDGLTDFELANLTGLQQTSIGKRRGELRDAGLVRDSGRRRPAPSGSMAIVWEAVIHDGAGVVAKLVPAGDSNIGFGEVIDE